MLYDVSLYVTLTTYKRALTLVNAICVAAHDRHFKASFDREAKRFQIKIEDTILNFAVRERQARVTGPRTGIFADLGGSETKLVPRDKLAVVVEASLVNNFEIVDGDSGGLAARHHWLVFRLDPAAHRRATRRDALAVRRLLWSHSE